MGDMVLTKGQVALHMLRAFEASSPDDFRHWTDPVQRSHEALRAEVERLREERHLVQSWLRNMPDTADIEQARKKALEIADRIESLDQGTAKGEGGGQEV